MRETPTYDFCSIIGASHSKHIRYVVGLGNTGASYAHTYHNAGALFIDTIEKSGRSSVKAKTFSAYRISARCARGGKAIGDVFAAHTRVFMNESGKALRDIIRYGHVDPAEILVVHDDIDIPLGAYKISFNRGSAGHHGIDSIAAILGTKRFWRLRIGIRKGKEKAERLVLRRLSVQDARVLQRTFEGLIKKVSVNAMPDCDSRISDSESATSLN